MGEGGKPAVEGLATHFGSDHALNLRTDFLKWLKIAGLFGFAVDDHVVGADLDHFADAASFEGEGDFGELLVKGGALLQAPVAAVAGAAVLGVGAGEGSEVGAADGFFANLFSKLELGLRGGGAVADRVFGDGDGAELDEVFLAELGVVFAVEFFDLGRGWGRKAADLSGTKDGDDHHVLTLLAKFAQGHAVFGEFLEKLLAVAFEVFANDGIDVVINVLGLDGAAEFFEFGEDELAFDEGVESTLAQFPEFLIEFARITNGHAQQLFLRVDGVANFGTDDGFAVDDYFDFVTVLTEGAADGKIQREKQYRSQGMAGQEIHGLDGSKQLQGLAQ